MAYDVDKSCLKHLLDMNLDEILAIALDADGPKFVPVIKRLTDSKGIPIGKANDNPMLDTSYGLCSATYIYMLLLCQLMK